MQAMGIDLGSNTLRAVLLGEKDEILWEFECVVRTAEGFAKACARTQILLPVNQRVLYLPWTPVSLQRESAGSL